MVAVALVVSRLVGSKLGKRAVSRKQAVPRHHPEVGAGLLPLEFGSKIAALELAGPGQTVGWMNPDSGVSYKLTPADKTEGTNGCRKFRLVATGSFGLSEGRTVACPAPDGTWSLSPEVQLGRR